MKSEKIMPNEKIIISMSEKIFIFLELENTVDKVEHINPKTDIDKKPIKYKTPNIKKSIPLNVSLLFIIM